MTDRAQAWQPIAAAESVRLGTLAMLRMENGRVYRARWCERGLVTAWFPEPGQSKKAPIGLYDPIAFFVIAAGASFDDGTTEGMRREKQRRRTFA